MSSQPETASPPEFEALLEYIKRSRAFDFTGYKRAGLQRRIMRRMDMVGIKDFASYTDYLEVHPEEFTHLFNTILINVTGFFRDPQTWEYVAAELIPNLIAAKMLDEPIRVWSAACATGEEAYTLAILLAEALGPEQFDRRVKIFGTDVDEDALSAARLAAYTEQQVQDVPKELLEKYFESNGTRYAFRKEFRRACIFARHDLLQDAPISRIDLLVCRNALMYFNSEAQGRCLERFHFALNDRGVLLLGKAEMLFGRAALFTPIDMKRRAFARVSQPKLRDRLLVMTQSGSEPASLPAAADLRAGQGMIDHMRVREAAFNVDPIAHVIVDSEGFIALLNDRARVLFNLSDRDIGKPLQDLELSYRPVELRSIIEKAKETRRAVELKEVPCPAPDGQSRFLDVQVLPLDDADGALLAIKCTFQDVTAYRRLQEEVAQSRQELETAYEELQSTNEERETANEELQSTNEELETTNEEIQSTNEELETMNEELQSTNEELQATNDELQQRHKELQELNAFLQSILASLRSGVVVIDKDLRVRAWNPQAENLWGLRHEEVVGKHFLNLDIGLPVEQLRQIIRSGLNGTSDGSVTLPARNRRGRDFNCRVHCTSAATDGQVVWGVVLMMDEE